MYGNLNTDAVIKTIFRTCIADIADNPAGCVLIVRIGFRSSLAHNMNAAGFRGDLTRAA